MGPRQAMAGVLADAGPWSCAYSAGARARPSIRTLPPQTSQCSTRLSQPRSTGGSTRGWRHCQPLSLPGIPSAKLPRRSRGGLGDRVPGSNGGRGNWRGRRSAVALFTGIVEEMGVVRRLEQEAAEEGAQLGWTLEVEARETLQGTQLGDSIAVNGTCLTVTSLTPSSFTFGLAPETLRCTSLGELQPGASVNLERSLRPDGRMGGHFVQGHVDSTGTIVSLQAEGDSLWVRVRAPPDLMPYIVPKGYIAVDGTSLTVCEVSDSDSSFTFMLVAYTQQKIVIPKKSVGDRVNLEVDILGKYVGRIVKAFTEEKVLQR